MYQTPWIPFRRLTALLLAGAVAFVAPACDDDDDTPQVTEPTLLDRAAGSADLDVLEAAVLRAGGNVQSALGSRTGTLTVFAPTDAAFQEFLGVASEAQAIQAINNLSPEAVTAVLNYHVLPNRVASSEVPASAAVPTLAATSGSQVLGRVLVRRNGTTVRVNQATVVTADINGANGVVHVIDNVLDQPTATISETAAATPSLSVLVTALAKADLVGTFNGPGPFTVFAPTNDAFVSFLAEAFPSAGVTNATQAQAFINGLSTEQVTTILVPILQAHVLANNTVAYAIDVPTALTNLPTLNTNRSVGVLRSGGAVTVTGAGSTASNVVAADITTTNGVVHVIDRVIRVS